MDRRSLIKALAALMGTSGLPLAAIVNATGILPVSNGSSRAFNYAWLKGRARKLATGADVRNLNSLEAGQSDNTCTKLR